MNFIKLLNPEQKRTSFILQIGTFLEYFDLMLYLHMAVFLNELFLPKTNSELSNNVAAAVGFCTTYVFRPIGALIFGYIGDTYGRRITVIITTMMMAVCSVTIALTPTYAEIGSTATWIITICRITQGLTSMGEVIGAQIYLTELIQIPLRYPMVNLLACACVVGSLVSLTIVNCILKFGLNWRLAFWCGGLIAVIGTVARHALKETPEFLDAKLQLIRILKKAKIEPEIIKNDPIANPKVDHKVSLAYFAIQCSRPIWFYFLYFYCGQILKHKFGYSAQQIIQHNLCLSSTELTVMLINTFLCYKIYPLKIINVRTNIFICFIIFFPFFLNNLNSVTELFIMQIIVCIFQPTASPADATLFTHFPVFKRFTSVSFLYALARAVINIITSFGCVYLTDLFSYWGLLIIFIPVIISFKWGVKVYREIDKPNSSMAMQPFLYGR